MENALKEILGDLISPSQLLMVVMITTGWFEMLKGLIGENWRRLVACLIGMAAMAVALYLPYTVLALLAGGSITGTYAMIKGKSAKK